MGQGNDDRAAAEAVCDRMEHAEQAYCIRGEYSHQTYRAFLARHVVLTVASRMHAAIASASVGVPVVPLAYSVKTHGIFGSMLGQDDLIVDIRASASQEELADRLAVKIDDCWARRGDIGQQLENRTRKLAAQTEGYVALIRAAVSGEPVA
jgi:polysaccharide pyruvyl transferase WcaK-like protein